jgi:subtilisin family serine protease
MCTIAGVSGFAIYVRNGYITDGLSGHHPAATSRAERGIQVTVAIIDSGVHAGHPHVQGVRGGIGIDDAGDTHPDYIDRLGHGTAVAAVICEKAPQAELLAVKVFDRQLRATGPALLAAFRWAREARADIVNFSLGTTNLAYEEALAHEVRAAHAAGLVVVAAAPQGADRWLPGALPGVISVLVDMSLPRESCRASLATDGGISVAASGYPRPIPGVPPEKNLKGVSFAVANVTGLIAQAWPDWRSALFPLSSKSL